mgnify:FL=1
MAGGIWTSQNKVLPGVYINVKSQGNITANVGSRGVVAIAEPLSWGPTGIVQAITPGEELTPYIGYDITQPQALFLREMMKGSDTTVGPSRILLYRPAGTGGAKATATIGALTATALYEGVRGNDISIVVAEQVDSEGTYDISTVVDGAIVDEQSVTDLSQLVPNDWVTFTGTGTTITESAGTALATGKDPAVAAADYSAFLTAIEPYQFDVLVYDGTDTATIQAIAQFVERVSNNVGQKCQAVMAGDTAAGSNSEFVIAVNNGVTLDDGTTLTAQQATWWVGGAEAGALYYQSLTYARYPNAVSGNPKLTDAQAEAAVKAGQLCFIDNFGSVKVCTDINSLTTFTVEKGQEFSKNRVMRVVMQFCNDVYETFSNNYIGKIDNNEVGRNLLKGWIVGYLNEMQANNGIQNFTAEDVSVLPGATIDAVLVNVAIQPVDSIEKIYMSVTVSVNVETGV